MKALSRISIMILLLVVLVSVPSIALGQGIVSDHQGVWRAKVVKVVSERMVEIPTTDTPLPEQTIRIQVLEGPNAGQVLDIENDYVQMKKGDRFYLNHIVQDGKDSYSVLNVDRRVGIFVAIGIFVLAVLAFGGWQGFRSLVALGGSFLAIFYVLLPGILAGWNPIVSSFLLAGGVLFFAIFVTHGFNKESLVAYGGTMIAVVLTAILATVMVGLTKLTGITGEESVYLNFSTYGSLDMAGILLGAIIIGVLGVLDDIAVTQAAVVTELYQADASLSRTQVYRRALRIGREHVGALVNTLVLAYVGTALPLLLYMSLAEGSFMMTINMEMFATEIIRTTVGSVGLIMTVPIVTLMAVLFLRNYKPKHHHGHHHGHVH